MWVECEEGTLVNLDRAWQVSARQSEERGPQWEVVAYVPGHPPLQTARLIGRLDEAAAKRVLVLIRNRIATGVYELVNALSIRAAVEQAEEQEPDTLG
jgi:hypothetical protein